MGKRTPTPTYYTVHWRIKQVRGSASQYLCPCGERAEDWAYIGPTDPPFRDERGMPYSADLSHYEAMCTLCHVRLDIASRESCRRGHPWTVESTYIRPDTGARTCLICQRLRDADRSPSDARDRTHAAYVLKAEAARVLGLTQRQYKAQYGSSKAAARKVLGLIDEESL